MITPLDIRKLEFSKKVFGYDTDEVRASLESIARQLEEQLKENDQVSERLKIADERLNHFKLIEKTLQDSVLTMQTTLEEKRKSADQEAGLIIQEAKHKAASEVEDYVDRIKSLKTEIVALDNQKNKYFIRFKNFLLSQLDWLDAMERTDKPASGGRTETRDFRVASQDERRAPGDTSRFPNPGVHTG